MNLKTEEIKGWRYSVTSQAATGTLNSVVSSESGLGRRILWHDLVRKLLHLLHEIFFHFSQIELLCAAIHIENLPRSRHHTCYKNRAISRTGEVPVPMKCRVWWLEVERDVISQNVVSASILGHLCSAFRLGLISFIASFTASLHCALMWHIMLCILPVERFSTSLLSQIG